MKLKNYQVDDPHPTDPIETLEGSQQGSARLENYVRCEVQEVEKIHNMLFTTTPKQGRVEIFFCKV